MTQAGIKKFTVGIQEIFCYESPDGPKFVLLNCKANAVRLARPQIIIASILSCMIVGTGEVRLPLIGGKQIGGGGVSY